MNAASALPLLPPLLPPQGLLPPRLLYLVPEPSASVHEFDEDGDKLVCRPGEIYGGYRIESYLACGGMSQIFHATHPIMGRRVAFKVLKAHRRENTRSAHRIASEAMALAAIEHPNVVQVLHADVDPRIGLFIVMELLRGQNLRQILDKQSQKGRKLGLGEAAAIVLEVADAVATFHEQGIIHRDLKPENIFLHERRAKDRVVKLLDLGAAKLPQGKAKSTDKNMTVGTLLYMPREQLRDGQVTPRSDVYALALIFDELMAGAHPLAPGSGVLDPTLRDSVIRARILEGLYDPLAVRVPGFPAALSDFIARSTATDASERPATMDEFAEQLRQHVKAGLAELSARKSGDVPVGQGEMIALATAIAQRSDAGSRATAAPVASGVLPDRLPAGAVIPPFAAPLDERLELPSFVLIEAPGAWRFLRIPLRMQTSLGLHARSMLTIGGGESNIPLPQLPAICVLESFDGELFVSGEAVVREDANKPLVPYASFKAGPYRFLYVPATPDGLGIPPDYAKLCMARAEPLGVRSLLVRAGHKWIKDKKVPLRSDVVRLGAAVHLEVPLFRFPILHALTLTWKERESGYEMTMVTPTAHTLVGPRSRPGLFVPSATLYLMDWELTLLPADRGAK